MLKLLAPAVAAVLSLVLAGSAWGSATISVVGGEVLVEGTDASEDLLLRGTDELVIVRGRGGEFAATSAGPGCNKVTEDVSCFVGPAGARVRVTLGGGADRLEVLGTGEGELIAIALDLGDGDDRFDGSLLDETIAPGPGSDVVNAGAGADTVTYDAHPGPAGLRYAGGAIAIATIGAGTDTLTGTERIVGTPRADAFTGGPAAETLLGGAGDDTIVVTGPGRKGPDAVDCGSGRDSVTATVKYDTIAGCEVVNGVDSAPKPEPPVKVPPLLPPPPPIQVIPPPGGLKPTPKGTIDVVVRCAESCAGEQAKLQPPTEGKDGLPAGWAEAFGPLLQAAARDALLRALAEGAARTPADVSRLLAELLRMQKLLEDMNDRADKLGQQAREVRDAAARLRDEARRRALETLAEFQRRQALAFQQATMAAAAAAIDLALLKAIADKAKSEQLKQLAQTKLEHRKGHPKPTAKPAAARGSRLGRRIARRAAVALPRAQAKLRATRTAGVYRARVRMPAWLRAVSRTLRRGGTRTLPLRVRVGDDTASVRLKLRR